VLAVLVAGLAAFIAFYERDLPGSDQRRDLDKRVIRDLKADDVVALEIDWNGKKARLERDAAPATKTAPGAATALAPARDWRLVEPLTGRADRTLADRLANDLAGLTTERRLEGAERKDLGLEPPRGSVKWKTASGEGTLEIGGEIPASSDLVVAVRGAPAPALVGKSLVTDIDRAPGDWRAKEVLAEGREKIERIRVVPPGGAEETVLARKGEKFSVEKPFSDVADPQEVDPLLSQLTGLRVASFLDAPLPEAAEKGLAGAGRIELSLAGRTDPFVIEVGAEVAPGGNRYMRANGQSFEAKTELADAVTRPAAQWRSKSWTSFDTWKVERIRIEDAQGKLELARSSGDWLRDGIKIPYTDVGDLLYAITSARADSVDAGAAAAQAPKAPRLTIVFSDAQGAEETLTLGEKAGEHTPARVSGRAVVLELPSKAADEVITKVKGIRDAEPVEAPKATDAGDAAKKAPATPAKDAEEKRQEQKS